MTNRRIALALCALALVSLPAEAQVCPNGGDEAAYDANYPLNQRNVVVPAGCTKLQLKAWGCGGARGNSPSGGGAGFAQGNFRIPATPARTIALNYNFGLPGTGTGAGCVGLVTDVTNSPTLVPLVVAAGGGGGGNSTEPVGGTPRVGGRGGAGGRNGQAGESVTGDCSTFAGGGGGATPTTPGAGGIGTPPNGNGQSGQCGPGPAGPGPGGPGWWMVSGDGSPGHCGGGGGGAAYDHWSGDPANYCRYRVGAGGGGGSSAVHVSAFAPLPTAIEIYGDGVWQTPGNSGDPDRFTPAPANQWAGDGATPSAAATKGRVIARWRGPFGFFDVAPASPYRPWIEKLACNGITTGCGNDNFCPTLPITREQMAPWLLVAKEGAGYTPPPCVTPGPFGDVPCSSPYASWIQELVARQVTGGCGGGNYCPTAPVTREQMAVFLLRTLEGPTYVPPPCVPPGPFNDVPCSSPYAAWIQELVARGITSGCGNGNYCPTAPVTREQMAVFLGVTFSLPDCP